MSNVDPLNLTIGQFRYWEDCEGVVYVFQVIDTELVKIGFTTRDPVQRMASLQTGCPFKLRLLAYWQGSREDEQAIHAALASCRTTGEWFDPHYGMAEWLSEVGAVFEALQHVRGLAEVVA